MTASTRPFVICSMISDAVSANSTVMVRGNALANRTRSDALRINAATAMGASVPDGPSDDSNTNDDALAIDGTCAVYQR